MLSNSILNFVCASILQSTTPIEMDGPLNSLKLQSNIWKFSILHSANLYEKSNI